MFSHFRRIIAVMFFVTAIAVLGLIIDAAVRPVYDVAIDQGVMDGPFAQVFESMDSLMWLIVPFLLVGVFVWLLVGPVQRTRREQEQRRLR